MFKCINCGRSITTNALGTSHRNHCPFCLYSKHLDNIPGDRASSCGGSMAPIGLTFKEERNKDIIGELMLVHQCLKCGVVGKNRLAGDDQESSILAVYKQSLENKIKTVIVSQIPVRLLDESDEREIMTQLFGKNYA